MTERTFTDSVAVRERVPLLIGLVGPSGSGKTKSALRLAGGIQRVVGGEVYGVDTEARRMLHYADAHKFRHIPFEAPFDPLSYLAAAEYCAKKGAKTIIFDSASHMHEGVGGTLEAFEAECERLVALWKTTRDKAQMAAWKKPKGDLRRFLNTILQMPINTIWCFRAKEKIKVIPGKPPEPLGFMPIAGDEMIYEMTVNCLLYPNSGGIPSWHPDDRGEKAIIKLPEQFKSVFADSKPLDEDIGAQLAQWAAGDSADKPKKKEQDKAIDNPEPVKTSAPNGSLSGSDVDALVSSMDVDTLPALGTAFRVAVKKAKDAGDRAAYSRFVKVKNDMEAAIRSQMPAPEEGWD
jgi:energy-coupling factor transporter ATP-binding protein EcfA2